MFVTVEADEVHSVVQKNQINECMADGPLDRFRCKPLLQINRVSKPFDPHAIGNYVECVFVNLKTQYRFRVTGGNEVEIVQGVMRGILKMDTVARFPVQKSVHNRAVIMSLNGACFDNHKPVVRSEGFVGTETDNRRFVHSTVAGRIEYFRVFQIVFEDISARTTVHPDKAIRCVGGNVLGCFDETTSKKEAVACSAIVITQNIRAVLDACNAVTHSHRPNSQILAPDARLVAILGRKGGAEDVEGDVANEI